MRIGVPTMNSMFQRFQIGDYVSVISTRDRVFRGKLGESNAVGVLLWEVEVLKDGGDDWALDHRSPKVFLPWHYIEYMSEDMREVKDREFPRTI